MSTDYREKERAFLDALKDDTGRDLGEWMAAISAQDLPHRNDIIDWLRQQGFMFSKASWLERVHHNGGKAIYSDAVLTNRAMPKRFVTPAFEELEPEPSAEAAPKASVRSEASISAPDSLDELLASAKAYRPLAQHLLKEIAKAVPGSAALAAPGFVSLELNGQVFGALVPGPKELRLALDVAAGQAPALVKTRVPNPVLRLPPSLARMALLNDVRQIDAALVEAITCAACKTGG